MSDTHDDGGPAFPRTGNRDAHGYGVYDQEGMTLRDYFAAQALIRQPTFPKNLWHAIRWALGFDYVPSRAKEDALAEAAYRQADAMLKAREA